MKKIVPPLLLSLFGLFAFSCVYDDPTAYDPTCGRYVEAHAVDGNDAQVSGLWVYVYDQNGLLIGFHKTEPGVPLPVGEYRDRGKIKIVVWGNASGQGAVQNLPEPILGSSINDHRLTQNLSGGTIAGSNLNHPPSDLFFGTLDVDFSKDEGSGQTVTPLLLARAVSSFVVTVRGIGQAFDGADGDYFVVVRHPYGAVDFGGNPIGPGTVYMPKVAYDPLTDQLIGEVSLALPTGEAGVVVELYSGGQLVYTAAVDSGGRVLSLTQGQLSNILIDLSRVISVELVVSRWGEVWIFEDFA